MRTYLGVDLPREGFESLEPVPVRTKTGAELVAADLPAPVFPDELARFWSLVVRRIEEEAIAAATDEAAH